MIVSSLLIAIIIGYTSLTIKEPVDGEIYNQDWLTVRAIVENDNEIPDSVHYSLNGEPVIRIPRLNTDWYTYMGNDLHTGYSESPAPIDNTILWTASVTGVTHEFCSPVIVKGIVYFVSDENSTAYALNAVTGDILWQYDVVDHVDDAVTWYDNKIYIAADSAWCLDAVTGVRIWAFKPTPYFKMNGTPALNNGAAYFSFAPNYYSLVVYALNAQTGAVIWSSYLPYYSTGCVTIDVNKLFVPTYHGPLYALNVTDGSIIWENSSSSTGYWDSSPVVVNNVIYICGNDGVARAIDKETGIILWESQITGGGYYIAATPAYGYDKLFFADQISSFHCLDGETGSTVWTVPGVQHGSSAVADGIVYFGEGADRDYGKVRALSATTGDEIWSYQTGGIEIYSSPAITDGILYIAGMDGNLYAFGTGLKYTYFNDLHCQVGSNELIVTSFDDGIAVAADTITFTVTVTGISLEPGSHLNLISGPNFFVSTVMISFELTIPGYTSVEIYDLSGRCISKLIDAELNSGQHSFQWNGTDYNGYPVSGGRYICRIHSGKFTKTMNLYLLR